MKVGDLIRYMQAGSIHLVVAIEGDTFYLSGWGDFPFSLQLTEYEVISESR
jgi:hypothetical protein